MGDLASSAVRSLLGLLREEAQQLTGVGEDVRFIQEEMESMESFLQHLDETRPAGGDHGAPVRTWMKQVRDVAFDCSSCIDLYVRKGRGRLVVPAAVAEAQGCGGGRLMGFLRSLPWSSTASTLGTALLAQRDAAAQIRQLRVRVHDVSERRHRYGVELPKMATAEDNDRRLLDLGSQEVPKQLPTLIFQLPKPRTANGEAADPYPVSGLGRGTISMEVAVSSAMGGSNGSGGGGYHHGSRARPAIAVNSDDNKQQTAFIIQLSSAPKMTDGEAEDPVTVGGRRGTASASMEVAVSSAIGGSSGGDHYDGSGAVSSDIGSHKGADHDLVKKGDKQPLKYSIQLSTQTVGSDDDDGGRPVMAVSDDVIREILGFSEPNILEEKTKELVKLLTSHEDNREESDLAAKQKGPPPLDNIICIAAPDKDDGGDLVQKVLGDPRMASAFKEVKLLLDIDFLSSALQFWILRDGGLWFILRFLLDHLFPDEAIRDIEEKDTWDEAKIAEEIGERKRLKGEKSLFVIEGNVPAGPLWDLIKEALGTFGCAPGSALIVVLTDMGNAEKISRERGVNTGGWPLVIYSLVDYWSTKALQVLDRSSRGSRSQKTKDYLWRNMRGMLRQIQYSCEPQAFCMKMFVHYLCANPKRSKEDLDELLVRTLMPTGKLPSDGSDATKIREGNGKALLRFCYDDLPRPYRSCLLYLAIFPPDRARIWQSRLVMRWVVEGLITGRGMRRAALEADRCFDTLVNRGFVCPEDITAAGKVRACSIPDNKLIQEFISDGAKEEQFLHPRLSHHLAQHFSVHCDIQLRRSDNIKDFLLLLDKKSRSRRGSVVNQPQLHLIKVLDLEGCQHFKDQNNPNNPREEEESKNLMRLCLKNICKKMLLLKYLSLRNTDLEKLPRQINNLLHLEILDIQQTKVPSDGTKDIMLPKLKCLLAGHTQTPSTATGMIDEKPAVPSVQIPSRIRAMPNIEVLSHVNASHDAGVLESVGHLWQLTKLGVVIDGNLKGWLKAISDLNECLRSLSIHIENQSPRDVGQAAAGEQAANLAELKLLERLSIRGSTSGYLLPLFLKAGQHNLISKLTLRDTLLTHNILEAHLKNLSNLQCIKLRHESYNQIDLTFKPRVLPKLKFLGVECGKITHINFCVDAAPNLKKIVWSFNRMESLSGIKNLPVLKELVLKGEENTAILHQVRKDIAGHPNFPILNYNWLQD
ncbi:hypothetical protein U9M48_001633 [Paspalum notatum var. saurae]|uniref:Rx N-terminal domain-containing protein n=1 Tax=Paspalum notatum var. saurae TaxID=547442 RepID=A0AAQ3PIF7_PASNO